MVPTSGVPLWELAAVVVAPASAVWALEHAGGAALTHGAIKLAAKQVLDIPCPADKTAWAVGAAALRDGDLDAFASAMAAAYGFAGDHPVIKWWRARLPRAFVAQAAGARDGLR